MGILNRWRQFGRRYFWPHLLLGVVAASIGVPAQVNGLSQPIALSANSSNIDRSLPLVPGLGELALQKTHHRPLQNLNPWQQYAVRNFLIRLAVNDEQALPPDEDSLSQEEHHSYAHLALLDSLSAQIGAHYVLFTASAVALNHNANLDLSSQHVIGLWLAQVQGIRAGPLFLFES